MPVRSSRRLAFNEANGIDTMRVLRKEIVRRQIKSAESIRFFATR